MNARPAILQLLKRGRLLAGSAFPGFVATWNWLVEAFDAMKGDRDLSPADGLVYIDRTDTACPVVRLDINNLTKLFPAGGGATPGIYEPVFDDAGTLTGFGPGYWPWGRDFRTTVTQTAGGTSGLVGLVITPPASASAAPTAEVRVVAQWGALPNFLNSTLQSSVTTTIPLYQFKDGAITHDFRALAAIAVRE